MKKVNQNAPALPPPYSRPPQKRTHLTMTRTAPLLLLLLLHSAAPARAQEDASAVDGEALLRRVQQQYESAEGLRASFTQQTISPFSEDTLTFEGTLLLEDNRYRIETRQQTLVTDGTTTWIYNPSTNQVIINRYVNDETTITPNEIFTDYLGRYNIESTRTVEQHGEPFAVIELTAEEASAFYQEVTLHIRRRDAALHRVRLVDQNEATTIFRLDDIQFDPVLEPEVFTFSPPVDAEVVDLRS